MRRWFLPRANAFGIVGAFSSVCHPEERRDEGSAVAFLPVSGTTAQVPRRGLSNLQRKAGKNNRGSFTAFRMTIVVRKEF
jgi:hypothetical protein